MQIVEYVDGRRRIIKHVGSAHTEAELGFLVRQAQAVLDDGTQGVLDLGRGAVPAARRVAMVEPAADRGLFDGPVARVPAPLITPARVVGTAAEVVFDALAGVYADLGFDAVGDGVFRDLVITRIVEPTSLLDAERVLADMGREAASYATMKRTLARCTGGRYRDQLARLCFNHAVTSGDVSLIMYDVTTLYWEAEKEDKLRKVGYSKERRVDPQIVVGLLVDRGGFPLEIGCFEGDKAETLTIVPIVKQFVARHDLAHMVVVADAGMLSQANLKALAEEHLSFIVGSRQTKAPIDLESHFRWHGNAFTDGQIIDTITPKNSRKRENDTSLLAEPVWDPGQHPGSWRAVWAYSKKRSVRDNKTITIQENRAQEVIAGTKKAKVTRFVRNTDGKRSLDQTSVDRARKLAGLKGYVSNIPATIMPAAEVISSYHDLWSVERSFRMSKTDLRARPMFARRRDAIEAHLTIVFTALAVAREVQARTGLSIRQVVRQLRLLRSATIAINGTVQTFPPVINPEQQSILNSLAKQETGNPD